MTFILELLVLFFMKVVNISGGLGNQMFQYAFAISLKCKLQENVLIDIHHFKGYNLHNGFEINKIFSHASLPIAQKEEINKVSRYIPNYKLSRIVRKLFHVKSTEFIASYNYKYLPEVYTISGDCYFEGYWQSYYYFKDIKKELIAVFEFPIENDYNKKIRIDIEQNISVGVHVRRGDYIGNTTLGNICNLDYYKRALDVLLKNKKNYVFYIFSNDIYWCSQNILPMLNGYRVVIVDGNVGGESFYDMYLMTKCNYLIIANSSFSWWGAFLNPSSHLVIAPKGWSSYWKQEDIEIYDPKWVII